MWAALRSDLREFVSTVAEESSTALAAIDSKLQKSQDEQDRDESEIVVDEDGNVIYSPQINLSDLILDCDIPDDVTIDYDEDEKKDSFVRDEGVEECWKGLVPEKLTEEEFWRRYFYVQLKKEQRPNVLSSMKNLVEGAVRAVAPKKPGVRPPFVMNTAVDEDDLGWDDEEEEEEEEGSEQIDFDKDEKWKQKLAQLEEERDLLHQTVEMQRKELTDMHKQQQDDNRVAELRNELQLKNDELQSLKQSLEDDPNKNHIETIAQQEATIAKLTRKTESDKNEIDALTKRLAEEKESYENAIQTLNRQLAEIKVECEQTKKEVKDVKAQTAPLADEIVSLKQQLEEKNKQLLKKEDANVSPNSFSSGEKISHEKKPTIEKVEHEEDDDDWGEEWGDDIDAL